MTRTQPIVDDPFPVLPPTTKAEIDAARFYEHQLVPALFRQYVPPVTNALRIDGGERVLDVACGSGVVARAMAEIAGSRTVPVGLDIAPGMLAVARDLEPAIDWRHGDAQALPFADASFDRVACQFGLMFFPDPVEALREMLRVLKPGGRLAMSVWDEISRNPGSAALVGILERLAGPEAANALRVPFCLGDRDALASMATAAGIDEVDIETRAGESHYPRMQVVIDAEIRGWLPIMGVHLDEALIEAIEGECRQRCRHFLEAEDGAFRSPTSAHILSGMRRD